MRESLENLKNFQVTQKVDKAIYYYITYQILSNKEESSLTELFNSLDCDRDGKLSREEIQQGFEGFNLSEEELDRIMRVCDTDHSGYIDFTEFLMASQDWRYLLEEGIFTQAFKNCISPDSDEISIEDMKKNIQGIPNREWNRFLKTVGETSSQRICVDGLKHHLLAAYSGHR